LNIPCTPGKEALKVEDFMGRENGLGRSRPSWGEGEEEVKEGRPARLGIGGGEHSGGAEPTPMEEG